MLSYYQHVTSQRPLPVALKPNEVSQLVLEVGDDLKGEKDRLEELQLILQFRGRLSERDVLLKLNGHELAQRKLVAHEGNRLKIAIAPDPSLVKRGPNVIEASLKRAMSADAEVTIDRVRLWVRFKK